MKLKDVLAVISYTEEIIIEEWNRNDPNDIKYAWHIRPMEEWAEKNLPLEAEVVHIGTNSLKWIYVCIEQ